MAKDKVMVINFTKPRPALTDSFKLYLEHELEWEMSRRYDYPYGMYDDDYDTWSDINSGFSYGPYRSKARGRRAGKKHKHHNSVGYFVDDLPFGDSFGGFNGFNEFDTKRDFIKAKSREKRAKKASKPEITEMRLNDEGEWEVYNPDTKEWNVNGETPTNNKSSNHAVSCATKKRSIYFYEDIHKDAIEFDCLASLDNYLEILGVDVREEEILKLINSDEIHCMINPKILKESGANVLMVFNNYIDLRWKVIEYSENIEVQTSNSESEK